MTNEQTNTIDTQGTNPSLSIPKTDEPLSLVDEAKKVRDEIRMENDRREKILQEEQKLKANDMLGGTTGGRVEIETKEETPNEYRARIDKEISEGKHDK